MGPDVHRSVCNQANDSAVQLETRPRSDGNGCLYTRLDGDWGGDIYVCQPPLELDRHKIREQRVRVILVAPVWKTQPWYPNLIQILIDTPALIPYQSDLIIPISQTSNEPSTSRVACLRGHFRNQGVSEEGSELLLASWRQKSSKSYDGMFRRWCDQRQLDPVSGPISGIINFLTELFKDGYQYRSLNAYRSAISSVHDRADGYEIGQHPLVKRLLRGAFNQRPPKPRYEVTWNVTLVLDYMDTLGESQDLSLQELSWKMVMLMALTRPSRSADLAMLDCRVGGLLQKGSPFKPQACLSNPDQTIHPQSFSFQHLNTTRDYVPKRRLKCTKKRQSL